MKTNSIPGGRVVDNERFPKLGFISARPDLVVSKIRDVTSDEEVVDGSGKNGALLLTFTVRLTADDGKRLQALTATNVSKQLLITIGDEPVSAPQIRAPLESSTFVIECNDRGLAAAIKEHLGQMKRD